AVGLAQEAVVIRAPAAHLAGAVPRTGGSAVGDPLYDPWLRAGLGRALQDPRHAPVVPQIEPRADEPLRRIEAGCPPLVPAARHEPDELAGRQIDGLVRNML